MPAGSRVQQSPAPAKGGSKELSIISWLLVKSCLDYWAHRVGFFFVTAESFFLLLVFMLPRGWELFTWCVGQAGKRENLANVKPCSQLWEAPSELLNVC